ncbi:MAG: peptide ABC transporter substrate-binding protein [Thermomicrobiales bacterium]|nr:peptide ABC transporter substrate-binding protein [Thermomicrobiales bacterium]
MANQTPNGPFSQLHAKLRTGEIGRREFTMRALALGVGLPIVSFVLRAEQVAAGPRPHVGWGVAAQTGAAAPSGGTEGKTRGEGGELKLIQWQAPTMVSPHVSTGDKDYLAACVTLESLMSYLPDGTLIPVLITEVPTVQNGLLAEDLGSVTYKLRDDIVWSDGEPLTADDVVFTWQWIMDPANASVSAGVYGIIKEITAEDAHTAKVTFTNPTANWFEPHAGARWGYVYPKHVLDVEDAAAANEAFLQKPVCTGPYVVDTFAANDQITYVINEKYREPTKPYFSKINLKGGGDAASAARAVLQTGDFDFAWNVQVAPDILAEMEKGGKGHLVTAPGTSVERIQIQFADPNKEVDGQRAEMSTKHPFFSDKAVRQALNLSAQRDVISKELYGEGEPPTANILAGLPSMESPNTSWEWSVDKGAQLLEDAGWTMQGDVRAKDGVELSMTYATTINDVRQKTQAIIKQSLEKMGFKVQLIQIDAGIFFDGSPGNEQNINHMYWDVDMYTNNATTPIPVAYMINWYAGPDGENIAQKSNDWNGQNYQRYNNPEFDKLFEQVRLETDIEKAAQLFIQMNDILIDDVAVVPLVNRAADKYAISNTLNADNVAMSDFEYSYWNVANWVRTEG